MHSVHFFHWIFHVAEFWNKFKSKNPTNTPPNNRPYTLIKSKMGFHLALLLSNHCAICTLCFSSKSCVFLTVRSTPIESWRWSQLLPAFHSLTTWWQRNVHLPAQEVGGLWFPPSLLVTHSNDYICRWQLQSSAFLLSISSKNLIEYCLVYFSNKLCNISKDIKPCYSRIFLPANAILYVSLISNEVLRTTLELFFFTNMHSYPFCINSYPPRQYLIPLVHIAFAFVASSELKVLNN